jgi:hypothetical protein
VLVTASDARLKKAITSSSSLALVIHVLAALFGFTNILVSYLITLYTYPNHLPDLSMDFEALKMEMEDVLATSSVAAARLVISQLI